MKIFSHMGQLDNYDVNITCNDTKIGKDPQFKIVVTDIDSNEVVYEESLDELNELFKEDELMKGSWLHIEKFCYIQVKKDSDIGILVLYDDNLIPLKKFLLEKGKTKQVSDGRMKGEDFKDFFQRSINEFNSCTKSRLDPPVKFQHHLHT